MAGIAAQAANFAATQAAVEAASAVAALSQVKTLVYFDCIIQCTFEGVLAIRSG